MGAFTEVAQEYDKYRPSYPYQLFLDILEYAPIKPSDSILEIGCGTGQVTKGFVELGYDNVTCIELGQKLAEFRFSNIRNSVSFHSTTTTWI